MEWKNTNEDFRRFYRERRRELAKQAEKQADDYDNVVHEWHRLQSQGVPWEGCF